MIEMTTQQHQQSARIYTFPSGGRDALRNQRTHDMPKQTTAHSRLATALCTDSWYHAAAIEEDEKAET